MRGIWIAALAGCSLALWGCPGGGGGGGGGGPTVHDTDIAFSETWRAAGNPHIVQECITVGGTATQEATLTIEAGVEVRFGPDGCLIVGEVDQLGSLQAVGTAADPVLFTAHSGSPTRGYWRGIVLGPFDTGSTFTNATIEYGGQVGVGAASGPNFVDAALLAWGDPTGPSATLTDVTVQESETAGIGLVLGFHITGSSGLTVTANETYAMHIEAVVASTIPTGAGTTYTGNGQDAIYLVGGSGDVLSNGSHSWGDAGVPWVITENLTVDGGDLSVQVNTAVRVEAQGEIEVFSGTFSASSATFAGWPTDDTLWGGIYYDVPGTGTISNSTISYGGNRSVSNSAGFNIYVDDFDQIGSGLPTVSNNTIGNSSNDGISAWFVTITSYQNNTFTSNGGTDIYDYFDDEAYNQ